MKKEMVVLYYGSSKDARADCELLGIDKRRVTNIRRGSFMTRTPDGEIEVKAYLKVSAEHLDKIYREHGRENILKKMHHVDDESYF